MNSWKTNIRAPLSYTTPGGTSTMRPRPKLIMFVTFISAVFLVILLIPSPNKTASDSGIHVYTKDNNLKPQYNATYPLSPVERTSDSIKYRIGMITDLDTNSKLKDSSNTWVAYFKKGHLTISSSHNAVTLHIEDDETPMKSQLSQGGRAMELSELVAFNGKLYTVDDRTGVVYEVIDDKDGMRVLPWVLLRDGDGTASKGLKGEWMAVKDHVLYVGGLGKEWTTITGVLVNLFPQWIKSISQNGVVQDLNWVDNYNAMRNNAGFPYPGYMIHESGVWSDKHQSWFFLPRRASKEMYDEVADEHRATNLIIKCDRYFKNVKVTTVGQVNSIRGFSSFKFVPGTGDNVIVALKTEEDRGNIATYISVFNLDGTIIVPDTKFADIKYEGIEFI